MTRLRIIPPGFALLNDAVMAEVERRLTDQERALDVEYSHVLERKSLMDFWSDGVLHVGSFCGGRWCCRAPDCGEVWPCRWIRSAWKAYRRSMQKPPDSVPVT